MGNRKDNKNTNSCRPWDIQPGETAKAYEAFQRYLELGVYRSLAKLSQVTGKHPKNMQVWSRKYSWVIRARAYDAYVSSLKTESTEDDLGKMTREHKHLLEDIRNAIMAPVLALTYKIKSQAKPNIEEYENMSIVELLERIEPFIKHIPGLIKLERLLHGLPTEKLDANFNNGEAFTKKELREYILNIPTERLVEIIERAKCRYKKNNKEF